MLKSFHQAKDPMSSYTHFLGALLSVLATLIMLSIYRHSGHSDSIIHLSILLFGFSLVALYSASCIYHFVVGPDALSIRLRKLDHAMIYVLIAGTYTPICAKFLSGSARTTFIAAIWGAALLGIVIKVAWLNAPRWLYTSLYLIMGWALLFDFDSFRVIPLPCLALIACGGISYTIGAIIYIAQKPDICKNFGFHEIFHVLIMIGSAFHIAAVACYVL
ncbi:MAG: hemolysin III family protein [Faecalibacterium sp.]